MTEDQEFFRTLGERITRLETLVTELPGRIDDKIVARDNATRQLVAFNQDQLTQLREATNTLTSTVDALHRRVDQGDHVTGTLKTQQPTLEAKIEELEDVIATKVEEARVEKLATDLLKVQNQLTSARGFLIGVAAASGLAGGGVVAVVSNLIGGG